MARSSACDVRVTLRKRGARLIQLLIELRQFHHRQRVARAHMRAHVHANGAYAAIGAHVQSRLVQTIHRRGQRQGVCGIPPVRPRHHHHWRCRHVARFGVHTLLACESRQQATQQQQHNRYDESDDDITSGMRSGWWLLFRGVHEASSGCGTAALMRVGVRP